MSIFILNTQKLNFLTILNKIKKKQKLIKTKNNLKKLNYLLTLTSYKKKIYYKKSLYNKINKLKQENEFSNNIKLYNKYLQQNLTIYYIITISFLKTNTIIHLSNSKGNIILFYSAGNVGIKGKQKIKRKIVINKLLLKLVKKIPFINKKPIALHLINVKFYKKLIIKQLKKNIFIKIIKSFNLIPYNGCRKKKIRRKKKIKNLIVEKWLSGLKR